MPSAHTTPAERRKRARAAAARTPRRASRKVATNVSLRGDLVLRARALELNFSEVFERALVAAISEAERAAWLAENQDAIADYNARIAERGAFSDAWRRF